MISYVEFVLPDLWFLVLFCCCLFCFAFCQFSVLFYLIFCIFMWCFKSNFTICQTTVNITIIIFILRRWYFKKEKRWYEGWVQSIMEINENYTCVIDVYTRRSVYCMPYDYIRKRKSTLKQNKTKQNKNNAYFHNVILCHHQR